MYVNNIAIPNWNSEVASYLSNIAIKANEILEQVRFMNLYLTPHQNFITTISTVCGMHEQIWMLQFIAKGSSPLISPCMHQDN